MFRRLLHELPRDLMCSSTRPRRVADDAVKLVGSWGKLEEVTVDDRRCVPLSPRTAPIAQELRQDLAPITLRQSCEVADVAWLELVEEGKVKAEGRDATGGALDVHTAKLVVKNVEQGVCSLGVARAVVLENPMRCEPIEQRHQEDAGAARRVEIPTLGPVGVVSDSYVHDHLCEMAWGVVGAFLTLALRVFGAEEIFVDCANGFDRNHAEVVGPKGEHSLPRADFTN